MLLRSPPRLVHLRHLRLLSNAAPALEPPTLTQLPSPTEWTEVPVSVRLASSDGSLFHFSLDLSSHPSLLASHVAAGQYLPFRLPFARDPIFFAICSPPPAAGSQPKSFDFLVPCVDDSPQALFIRDHRHSDKLVSVGGNAVGRGFEVSRIADAREVLLFAYGYGIGPIRSFIESGFCENGNIDVSLFYGAANLSRMAYQERFNDWESRGIKIIPVLFREGSEWNGQRGYIHTVFKKTKKVVNPSSTGAVLCGRRIMYERVTRALVADGVSEDRILTLNTHHLNVGQQLWA